MNHIITIISAQTHATVATASAAPLSARSENAVNRSSNAILIPNVACAVVTSPNRPMAASLTNVLKAVKKDMPAAAAAASSSSSASADRQRTREEKSSELPDLTALATGLEYLLAHRRFEQAGGAKAKPLESENKWVTEKLLPALARPSAVAAAVVQTQT